MCSTQMVSSRFALQLALCVSASVAMILTHGRGRNLHSKHGSRDNSLDMVPVAFEIFDDCWCNMLDMQNTSAQCRGNCCSAGSIPYCQDHKPIPFGYDCICKWENETLAKLLKDREEYKDKLTEPSEDLAEEASEAVIEELDKEDSGTWLWVEDLHKACSKRLPSLVKANANCKEHRLIAKFHVKKPAEGMTACRAKVRKVCPKCAYFAYRNSTGECHIGGEDVNPSCIKWEYDIDVHGIANNDGDMNLFETCEEVALRCHPREDMVEIPEVKTMDQCISVCNDKDHCGAVNFDPEGRKCSLCPTSFELRHSTVSIVWIKAVK